MSELNIWLVAMTSLLGSTILTTMVAILLKRSFDKFFSKRDKELLELTELRERRAHEERELLKKDMKQAIEDAIEPLKQDLYVIKKGTQAGLRHDLSMMADEWLVKGFCPRNVKDDFENLYRQYHQLGKNGVMDNIYQSILALPESEPKKRAVKKASTTQQVKSILNG
jgi:hypothetical protein